MVLAPALFGCAARSVSPASHVAPTPALPPSPPPYAQVHAAAPVHGDQVWALPQEWTAPLPGAWSVPAGWALPQGWPPPATWTFPWAAPEPPGRKPTAAAAGAPAAIAYARSRLGTPYCWGGTGPGCFDCSGLTSKSWKAGGKTIPRTSEAQVEQLPQVPLDKILPGDILWRPGHVALYVGDGQIIHAPRSGDVIKYAPATNFKKALRP
jgi:cell wall-associated NlpC family hydrolase